MTLSSACPSPVELTREYSIGPSQNTSAHLARCDRCAAEWASIERVVALAKQIPGHVPPDDRAAAVRSALLRASSASPSIRRTIAPPLVAALAAAAAVALVLGGYLLLRAPAPPAAADRTTARAEVYRAVVHAHPGATHAVVGAQPDEIVRLTDGKATFEVDHLREGERFRVVTGDAEVEVRGTVFDVTVEDDRLIEVRVISGVVEVRPDEVPEVTLVAGQWWRRQTSEDPARPREEEVPTIATASEPSRPLVLAHPAVVREGGQSSSKPEGGQSSSKPGGGQSSSKPRRSTVFRAEPSAPVGISIEAQAPPPVATDPQLAFDEGFTALRGGDFGSAAEALGAAAVGDDPISEDASFWRAVALARSGRQAQAARALQTFLARFPGSPRAGEASVMLGRLLLDAGNLSAAESRFRAALADPGARVRASAAAGLDEIARRRDK